MNNSMKFALGDEGKLAAAEWNALVAATESGRRAVPGWYLPFRHDAAEWVEVTEVTLIGDQLASEIIVFDYYPWRTPSGGHGEDVGACVIHPDGRVWRNPAARQNGDAANRVFGKAPGATTRILQRATPVALAFAAGRLPTYAEVGYPWEDDHGWFFADDPGDGSARWVGEQPAEKFFGQ